MTKDLAVAPYVNPAFRRHTRADDTMIMPAREIPSYNVGMAFKKTVANNFLINTWGGLGDQICAEPAIRFGIKQFKKVKMSLSSNCPSLYSHLNFHEVFDTREANPDWAKYLVFNTILPPSSLLWEFCSHMLTHCVDFPSICMWRSQMPVADREIALPDFKMSGPVEYALKDNKNTVVIHAGKHWQSKTFPEAWWNDVVSEFISAMFSVVLIGQKVDENIGYVNVNPDGCIDLRDKLSIPEFVSLLKSCKYLFSNDSSPIHAASAGDAFVGVVATCKHPDYILHWRHGEFSWNAKNYGLDGIWNHVDHSPAQETEITSDEMPAGLLEACLPNPKDVVLDYCARREALPWS